MPSSEYTYGYNVFKETYPERMERAKGEEYDDDGYIKDPLVHQGYINVPSKKRETDKQ